MVVEKVMIKNHYVDGFTLTLIANKHNVGVPEKEMYLYSGHMQPPRALSSTGGRRIPGTIRSLPPQCMLMLERSFSTQQPLVLGQALQLELGVRSEVCLACDKLCPPNLIQTWQMCVKPELLDMSPLSILFGEGHTNVDLLCR